MTTFVHPGFDDPVRESQMVFRAILDAMAKPGRIHKVMAPAAPPPPLDRATAAVLLTLVDGETSLWMDDKASAARDWAAFHCGSTLTTSAQAKFAVAIDAIPVSTFWPGTDEEPESSTTLILQVGPLGDGSPYQLDGPGLASPATLAVSGLSENFQTEWQENRKLFPRGIDIILCGGDYLAALPRTVRLERV